MPPTYDALKMKAAEFRRYKEKQYFVDTGYPEAPIVAATKAQKDYEVVQEFIEFMIAKGQEHKRQFGQGSLKKGC